MTTQKQTDLFEKTITEQFNEFDRANPRVWLLFRKFAFEMIEAGRKKVSHKMIIERIRWESLINTEDNNAPFKINNNYTSHYGRKFVRHFPQYTQMFNFRKQKTD